MTPEQFLSLAEIKVRCGISGADLDSQLTINRDAAIGVVESRTRRNIVDREAVKVRSPDRGDGRGFITFYVHDAKPITEATAVAYRTRQDDPGFARDGSLSIPASFWDVRADRVCVYNGRAPSVDGTDPGGVSPWPERDMAVFFETAVNVGIPDGKAPQELKAAALMIVRELQEGSLLDNLPPNIVDLVLRDHVKPAFSATDELLTDAGVE